MLALSMLQWWYGRGWLSAARKLRERLAGTFAAFSVGLLLQTLFAPWKQIISGPSANDTIGDKLRHLLDNLISRFIGFWVRIFTLMASIILGFLTAMVGVALLVAWPLVPVAILLLILRGAGAA